MLSSHINVHVESEPKIESAWLLLLLTGTGDAQTEFYTADFHFENKLPVSSMAVMNRSDK